MDLKRVTYNSFPWGFKDTNFTPKYGQNKIEAARAGKCTSYVTSK